MRKFKFMSKAVVGMMAVAMTMGSFSGVAFRQPTAVYALDVATDFSVSLVGSEKVTYLADSEFVVQVAFKNGETLGSGQTLAWTSSDDTNITLEDVAGESLQKKVKIGSSAVPGTEVKIMASVGTAPNVIKGEFTFKVGYPTFTLSAADGAETIEPGGSLQISADYEVQSGETLSYKVGSLSETDSETIEPISGVTISAAGLLQVGEDVPEETEICVTAEVTTGQDNAKEVVAIGDYLFITVGVDAPVITTAAPTVDYESMTLTFSTSDPYFTVDVLKKADDREKPSKSYTYTGGREVKIDLGFLKLKNDNILNVYGCNEDKTKTKLVTVGAQPPKDKFKIAKEKVNESELWKALGMESEAVAKGYQYRSVFGSNWYDLTEFKYTDASVAGTTVVVRKKPVTETEAKADTAGKTKAAPAGQEVKVKIAAAAKAPSVKIAYDKGTVGVKKSGQVMGIAGMASKDFVVPDENNLSVEDIVDLLVEKGKLPTGQTKETLLANGFALVVIARKEGKADSNPALIQIKALPQVDTAKTTTSTVVMANGKKVTLKKGTKDTAKVMLSGDVASFEYQDSSGKWKKASDKEIAPVSGGLTVRLAGSKEGDGSLPSVGVPLTPEATASDIDTITVAADGTDNPTDLKAGALTAEKVFKFKATAKKGSETVTEGVDYTWKVKDPNGKELKETDGFTWTGATLKIAAKTELVAGKYTVHAECGSATVTPEEIVVAEQAKVFDAVEVTLDPSTPTTYTIANFKTAVVSANGIKVSAKATNSGTEVAGVSFSWSITKGDQAVTAISVGTDGKLTIASGSESAIVAGDYVITATATPADGADISDDVTITLTAN